MKYSANSTIPKKRTTYQVVVNKLQLDEPIKKIAEETGVTRDTVYRI